MGGSRTLLSAGGHGVLQRYAEFLPLTQDTPPISLGEGGTPLLHLERLGRELAWREVGLNPYGNSVVVNAEYLDKNRALIGKFVKVTQRAFATCVQAPRPCVQALVDANGALKFDNELTNWSLVEVLMSDKYSKNVALGIHDDARMKADYELVRDYVGIDKPFDVKSAYTNEFLDRSVRMTK